VSLLESEFWLALGKVILAVGVIAFTFVTMVGGNPLHYVYGFRNWDREESFLVYFNIPSNLHLN
jgi:amino acid permease